MVGALQAAAQAEAAARLDAQKWKQRAEYLEERYAGGGQIHDDLTFTSSLSQYNVCIQFNANSKPDDSNLKHLWQKVGAKGLSI